MGESQNLLQEAQEISRCWQQVRQAINRPINALVAKSRMTRPQLSVMHALARAAAGLNLTELSRQVGLAHSTVSVIVARLERRGLVKRNPGSKDRRFTQITLSAPVRTFVERKLPQMTVDPLVKALRRASPIERATILKGMRMLAGLLAARK